MIMKKQIILSGLMLAALVGTASATIEVVNQDWSVGQTIADNSSSGLTVSQNFTGLADTISEVDVRLNISGGYNGDLYGYLTYNGQTVVLLNHVAGGSLSAYGSSASGFGVGTLGTDTGRSESITLSDLGGSGAIHDVGGSPVAVGNYTPDSGSSGAFATAFNGANPNGTWTLFLADLSAGNQSTLVSWGLDISVVPEPITYALGIFAGLLGLSAMGSRLRKLRA